MTTKARLLSKLLAPGGAIADGSVQADRITGTIGLSVGGTGAQTAPTARSNLGLAIGSDVQAWHSALDNLIVLAGTSGFLKKHGNNNWQLDTNTYLTGNQTITFSGDASGSGATSVSLTLANSGVTAGTYGSSTAVPVLVVDAKGRVTSVSTQNISGALTFTGDVTGTGSTGSSTALTLANSGVTAGTYTKVTVDSKGRATSGTTLSASDIPSLDASKITTGIIDAARLPSYVDDVLEFANLAGFPATGETGKIYVAIDSNKTYRWSGSTYIEISANVGTVTSVTGTGTVSGLTLSGTVTTSGSLTLGGAITGFVPTTGGTMTAPLVFTSSNTYNPIQITGGVAGYYPAVQDGNGRVNWYWNKAGSGGAPTFEVSGEDAVRMKFSTSQAAGTEAGVGVYWAAAGTAGAAITWTEILGAFHNRFQYLGNTILHSGNYNSYSPTLTGTGASGTWGINITGNAATVTSVTSSQVTTALGFTPYNSTNPSGYITNTGNARVTVENNGTVVGTRRAINFIPGTGISLNIADDSANEEVDVTVTNSGVTSVSGTGTVSGLTLSGTVTSTGSLTLGGAITGFLPSSGGTLTGSLTGNGGFSATGLFNQAFLQVTDSNNFWITPGNNSWGLYFETTGGGLLGGSGDSNRLGFVGNSTARFWVDLNNGNGWFGGSLSIANNTALHAGNFNSYALPLTGGTVTGVLTANGGSKITVQNLQDGGTGRGLYLWQDIDTNWVIYMSQSGASRSASGATAATSIDGRTAHHIRFRVNNNSTQGFLWENASEQAIMSLGADNGNLYTRGQIYAGNSTSNIVLHAGNYTGYANWGNPGTRGVWQISNWNQTTYPGTHFISSENSVTNAPTTDFTYGLQTAFHRDGPSYRTQMVTSLYSDTSIWVRNSRDGDVWTGWKQLLHSGNYTSYSPTLTGSGASGTWGISVTGSSNRVTYQGTRTAETGATVSTPSSSFDVVGAYSNGYPGTYGNVISVNGGGVSQLYMGWNGGNGAETGELYYRSMTDWRTNWGSWRRMLTDANYSSFALPLTGGTLTGDLTVSGSETRAIKFVLPSSFNGSGYSNLIERINFPWYSEYWDIGIRRGGGTDLQSMEWWFSGSSKLMELTRAGTLRVDGPTIRQGNNLARPLAQWGATSATGMVFIEFPGTTSNYGMIHAVVDIYEYNSNNVCTVVIGGHNWNGAWYNIGCNVIGFTDKPVRLGVRGGKYVICIGNSSSSWSYGQVMLRKINNGPYYDNIMDMGAQFVTNITTSESLSWDSGDLRALRTPASFNAGGAITQNGNQVLHAGNFTNYAPGSGSNWTFTELYSNSWVRNNNSNTGLYNTTTTQHWSSNTNGYWDASSTTSFSGIRFYTGGHVSSLRGYVYANTSNEIGFLNSSGSWSWRMDNSGNGTATGNVTAYSDERLKQNWNPLPDNFVERLASIKCGTYNRIDQDMRQVGVSAQSLQALLPEAVLIGSDENKTLSVAYGNAALAATVELAKRVVEQQQQIAELTALVKTLLNKE